MKITISDFEGIVDINSLARFAAGPIRAVKVLQIRNGAGVLVAIIDLDAFVLPDYNLPGPPLVLEKGQELVLQTIP